MTDFFIGAGSVSSTGVNLGYILQGIGFPLREISEVMGVNPFVVPLNRQDNATALAVLAVQEENTIEVADATGFIDGTFIGIADADSKRASWYQQVGAAAANVITVDKPIDFAFPIGSTVTGGVANLAVNGAAARQIFSAKPENAEIGSTANLTRLIFVCESTGVGDLSEFADLTALTNGITIRIVRSTGQIKNIFNAKSNADMDAVMFDFDILSATNPQQGVNGFKGRLTFSGASKMGALIQLGPGDDIECVVDDDLTGLIVFNIIAEGNVSPNLS